MGRAIIGVDAGTTNIKAAAFSLDGEELARSTAGNPVETPKQGWKEQDMTTSWARTATVIRNVVESLRERHRIVGVGITGQGDGCWLVDEAGEPVRNAILWSDGRASGIVDEWIADGSVDTIREVTGTDIFPGVTLPILQWLSEREPSRLDAAETVFYCKDWLKFKLTDERTVDYSDATLPFLDIERFEYAEAVFDVLDRDGLDALLPDLSAPTEIIGGVTAEASAQTGLAEGTPVISGVFDIPANAIGSGAIRHGESSSVVGTTSLNQTTLSQPPPNPEGHGYTIAVDEDFYLRSMASMAGTPNIDWAYEHIVGDRDFAAMETKLESVPVGSGGLLYHPYLSSSGERSPFLKTNARAQFIGLSPEHTQKQLIHAIYEGVSLAMRDAFEHISADTDQVVFSGGGSRSSFWCQLFADCLGSPIIRPESEELGAKGVAILVGVALGEYDSLESAVERTVTYTDRFEPDPEKVVKYDEWYEFYAASSRHMFDVWDERMAALDRLEALRATTPSI